MFLGGSIEGWAGAQ